MAWGSKLALAIYAVTVVMLHKQKYVLHIGSKNEVILGKICGKHELNWDKKGKKWSRHIV